MNSGMSIQGFDSKIKAADHRESPGEPPGQSTRLYSFVAALGVYVALVGLIVLAGWIWRVPVLTDWTRDGISMFPNTALCAICLGIAIIAAACQPAKGSRLVMSLAGGFVALIGGATAFEHLSGVNLGIDTLLFDPVFGQRAATAPLRMGPPASTSYFLLGVATCLLTQGKPARLTAVLIAMVTAFIALLSLTGYLFGADQLFGVAKYTGIAFPTSTVLAAASLAIMGSAPEHGIVAALKKPDAGGALLRRLILPMIVIPLLLGWLRIHGQALGFYDGPFGTALRTLVEIVLFVSLVIWTARSVGWHESAAQAAQWRLAAIVDSSHDAIVSKSLQGIIQSWNAGAEHLFGYQSSEAIGKHISLIIPPDRLSEEDEIIRRIRRGERIEHIETVRVRKNGKSISVSLTISPIRNDLGEITGASKIARDITERKLTEAARRASEERLRAVVEATPECVMIVRRDGALEYMNPAGLELIQSKSEESLRGSPVVDLIAPEHRQAWLEHHCRICAGEHMNWEFEMIGLEGARRWMETHAAPIELVDGQTAQLAVTREISSRRRYEQERESLLRSERAARSEAERALQLKDDFLATLSHELRTPLNAVLGWSQILRRSTAPEDLEQGLEVIERNAKLQAQLIDDLLDMSRIMSGKVVLDVQPTEMVMIVSAAMDSVRHSASAKEIRLRTFFDPEGGLVAGDATRLQQIVWNLLTNAIKFTPQGGGVDIIVRRKEAQIELIVRDTGIGIDPAHLPSIFERFRQVESSTTRRYGGLGLGLSIVKHLVELHGGSVRAESLGLGKGTSFVVELPIPVQHRGAMHAEPSNGIDEPWTARRLTGIKVLVVDDELDARTLVARVLSECGAEVVLASSAMEALGMMTSSGANVILSDIGMPEMDGYQFIRQVRALPAASGGGTPAVAVTAFARAEDRVQAMAAGFQEHLCKPIRPQELIVAIASVQNQAALMASLPTSPDHPI